MTRIRAVFLSTPRVHTQNSLSAALPLLNEYILALPDRAFLLTRAMLSSDETCTPTDRQSSSPSTLILLPKRAVGGVRDVYTLDCVHSVRNISPIGYVIAAELDHS